MKTMTLAALLAGALAFGTTMTMAQPAPHIGDGTNSVTPPYPYNFGGGSAHVGDGGNAGPAPTPYYSGTGSAEKGPASRYGQGNAQSVLPTSAQYDPPGHSALKISPQ